LDPCGHIWGFAQGERFRSIGPSHITHHDQTGMDTNAQGETDAMLTF
jgi:hypothetical protein